MEEDKVFKFVAKSIAGIKSVRPKTERKKITQAEDLEEIVALMAEGNALSTFVILTILINKQFGQMKTILRLDNMNIRGSQLAYAVDKYCEGSIPDFVKKVQTKDFQMVYAINIHSAKTKQRERAVMDGTAFKTHTPKIDKNTREYFASQDELTQKDGLQVISYIPFDKPFER